MPSLLQVLDNPLVLKVCVFHSSEVEEAEDVRLLRLLLSMRLIVRCF